MGKSRYILIFFRFMLLRVAFGSSNYESEFGAALANLALKENKSSPNNKSRFVKRNDT